VTDLVLDAPAPELGAYGATLRKVRPSLQLDTRLDAAISEWSDAVRAETQQRRPGRARALGPAIAAGTAAIAMAGLALWVGRGVSVDSEHTVVDQKSANGLLLNPLPTVKPTNEQQAMVVPDRRDGAFAVVPAGPYSLYPTDAAVFRVRTRLDAETPRLSAASGTSGEQQFWVDVRVANDGSMRIVQIVPAENSIENDR
jgi:hypothetical protein